MEHISQYPTNKIELVIDTDAYNEVDDQFAIAWALLSPERMHVQAVYAAPFYSKALQRILPISDEAIGAIAHYAESPEAGMEKSYQEIRRLFRLLKIEEEGRVFRGSDRFLESYEKPVESEAARDLVKRAMNSDMLYVVAIGAITNVVSAILMEPRIKEHITVIWLGGQPLYFHSAAEFNLMQDLKASQFLFDCGVPLVLIPCMTVASHLTISKEELRSSLMEKSPIGNYLGTAVLGTFHDENISMGDRLLKMSYLRGMDDVPEETANIFCSKSVAWSRIIWDIATIAYLMNPNWCCSTLVPAPILTDDMTWKTAEHRHPIRLCHYLNRDYIFGDMFAKFNRHH